MTRKTLSIGLFLPATTPFYRTVFKGMKLGFEQLGHKVLGGTEFLEEAELIRFCEQFKPDFIFEMNRSKNQIPLFPSSVKHIAWVVDSMGLDLNDFCGSEIVYLFGYAGWLETYKNQTSNLVDWLAPGFCPQDYHYGQKDTQYDFSFAGHMPLPWNTAELNRVVYDRPGCQLSFKELYDRYCREWTPRVRESYQLAQKIIQDVTGEEIEIPAGSLRYDIACRSSRMVQRTRLVDMMLKSSEDLKLYGPENWKAWPAYSRFYQKYLTSPAELCEVYQTSKVNFHEGVGPHFRVFDCMAAGGFLFCAAGPNRDVYGELNWIFTPGEHYIPFDEENFSELATYYLSNRKHRLQIAKNASEKVHKEHTWRHRAQKICQDFYKL